MKINERPATSRCPYKAVRGGLPVLAGAGTRFVTAPFLVHHREGNPKAPLPFIAIIDAHVDKIVKGASIAAERATAVFPIVDVR
jgi:hypothetical protein